MYIPELVAFIVAATALLGSPGPAIAALLAVGRGFGWGRGILYYAGLQVGLALAAGISVIGLFAVLQSLPWVLTVMTVVATIYLLYLAYSIATSPVGEEQTTSVKSTGFFAGILLGVTNPKAYIAFASLFASFQVIPENAFADSSVKWFSVVAVMIVVDFIWLWIGVKIGELSLSEKHERTLNIVLGGSIVVAALLAVL